MITLHLPSCLDTYPKEAALIGETITRYGELEYMLCRVVGLLTNDLDGAIKAMFRARGERARLQIADALASSRLEGMGIKGIFYETFDAIDICRIIRNSYAHAHWLPMSEGRLGFFDLERLAREKGKIDLKTMRKYQLNHAVLAEQTMYFAKVLHNLVHIFYILEAETNKAEFKPMFVDLAEPQRAQLAQADA